MSALYPAGLSILVAFASWSILRNRRGAAARIALIAFTLQAVIVVLVGVLVGFLPEEPNQRNPDMTCPVEEGAQVASAVVLAWVAAGVGGVVLSAIASDRRRTGAVVYWHLFLAPAAVLLPYVAFTLLLLSWLCGSS